MLNMYFGSYSYLYSKIVYLACRYDEPEWTDCDPFEMIRYRTLRLISGGRQCEEMKNITKHCTADELPPGRGKSLLELWAATFLPDWQPSLIFV